MLLLPTPVRQTVHGNSPELCKRSRPVPQIMIFVFPAFTLSPFSSIASFQVKSLLTQSLSDSAMITWSSAFHWWFVSFQEFIPPPGLTTQTVGPSCATNLLSCLEQASLDVVPDILSGSISYTCTPMQDEDLLEMIAI